MPIRHIDLRIAEQGRRHLKLPPAGFFACPTPRMWREFRELRRVVDDSCLMRMLAFFANVRMYAAPSSARILTDVWAERNSMGDNSAINAASTILQQSNNTRTMP